MEQVQKLKGEFTGHVESVDTSNGYDSKFTLNDDNIAGVKFHSHIGFCVSTKKAELTEMCHTLKIGDKVKVDFYVTGMSGVSKKSGKPYQINKLMVVRMDVLERSTGVQTDVPDDDSDTPF